MLDLCSMIENKKNRLKTGLIVSTNKKNRIDNTRRESFFCCKHFTIVLLYTSAVILTRKFNFKHGIVFLCFPRRSLVSVLIG